MMNYINLSELKIGRKQQAGVMSVYPLLAEDVNTSLANFEDIKFKGTSEYGTMVFENKSELPFIIPTGYSVITKQLAQDHALPFASLLAPNTIRNIDEACCIQQTQGGYIDGSKVTEFSILPLYIRKKHFEEYVVGRGNHGNINVNVSSLSFSRLWDCISSFQKDLVKKSEGNLVYFFNKFMDKLTQFNAEFEVVDGQRGAIIMLNDRIVGIEVAPTHKYWKTIWNSLIRDCYGSEVIRLTMLNLIEEFKTSQELDMDINGCKSVEEIQKAIDAFYTEDSKKVADKIKDLESMEAVEVPASNSLIKENSYGDVTYHIFKVKDKSIYGEAYCDKDQMIYCSVLF